MRIYCCDKCGKFCDLLNKLFIKEPIDGKFIFDFELCEDCINELYSSITKSKNEIYERLDNGKN